MDWFTVDRQGLAKILTRKGVAHIVLEPLSNAWDERVSRVDVTFERIPGTRTARLVVADDSPEGFADLSHAYKLFAESAKKSDATRRGRFNAGDKTVLAMAESASIASTTGTVLFDSAGRRMSRAKTKRGSIFSCVLRLTNEQLDECHDVISRLIPPPNIQTYYNGELLAPRSPVAKADVTLQTELADAEGFLRRSQRKTTISVYEPLPGEPATLYELGVPVCPTGDRFHVNIGQKVPLDMERTSVPEAYLSRVRALVLEATHSMLLREDATAPWVRDAMHNHADALSDHAIRQVTQLRFGDKAVSYDPSDPEANNRAVSSGFTVVHGGSMSKAEWDAVRRAGSVVPAGQVTPSPKPFSPDGKPLNFVPQDKWTPEIAASVAYFHRISRRIIGRDIQIDIASEVTWPFRATYGGGHMIFNLGRLGHSFFSGPLAPKNDLLLHELGHERSGNHMCSDYHDALTEFGAKLAQLALEEPQLFDVK